MSENETREMVGKQWIGLYCYYDVENQVWDIPFFSRDDVNAKRKFQLDAVAAGGETIVGKFTQDFDLYHIANFCVDNGQLRHVPALLPIVTGKEVKKYIG